jgi:hypothetical protein
VGAHKIYFGLWGGSVICYWSGWSKLVATSVLQDIIMKACECKGRAQWAGSTWLVHMIFESHNKVSFSMQVNAGKVVAVGPGAKTKDGNIIPIDVKEGDTVLLPEYGGTAVKLGGSEEKE